MSGEGSKRLRLPFALITFVLWLLAVMFSMKWADDGLAKPLLDTISHGISWNIVIAIAVLAAATVIWRWYDLRFVAFDVSKTLKIAWFPFAFLFLFYAMAIFLGLPPIGTLLFVAANTALVGLSEEWMFRGVLFQGLRSRFAIWPAIILSSVLFGSVHILNVLVTGSLSDSLLQAVTAAMSGLMFVALLIRTGSLWVPIIYHALWDLGTFAISAGADKFAGNAPEASGLMLLIPPALVLPNFLYALYLLRKVRNDNAPAGL
jgi:membrane protease YdiL (CAAX protease family)